MNKHLAILCRGAYVVAPMVALLGLSVGIAAVTFWAFNWAMDHNHFPAMIITWCVVLFTAIAYVAGLD